MEESKNLGDMLTGNFLLASLNVRIWSGKKTDKNATQELLADKGAIANAASVVKSLLAGNDAKLKETAAAFTRIRSFFYENTSPWTTSSIGAMKGDRLVSTVTSITFLGDFARLKKEADNALIEFLNEYDKAVSNSALSLGALYDPAQYPTKQQVATLFSASMDLRPIPESADFDRLQNVPAELATGLKDLYERNVKKQMDNALSDVQKRLLLELERMDTQLSKVAAGEKTRLFKSMTGNLKHLVGMARSINFTQDPEIEAVAATIEKHLLTHEVDDYKDNAALARANAGIAKGIIKRAREGGAWSVTNVGLEEELDSTVEPSSEEVEVTVEAETTPGENVGAHVNEQIDEDQKFLASLMDKIDDPEVGEPGKDDDKYVVEEEEEVIHTTPPISDPAVPDFDPDDVMFK